MNNATADGWLSCLGGSLLSGRGPTLHKHRSWAVSRRRCRLALFSLSSLRPTRPSRRFVWSRRFFKKALHSAAVGKAARVRGHRLMYEEVVEGWPFGDEVDVRVLAGLE